MNAKVNIAMTGLLLIISCKISIGQNLENLAAKDPLKVSGSINSTAIGYGISGIQARRDPFNWFLTGNLNFSLYGWNVPFSFSYSNQNKSFRQPFNQYGIAPEYKWIKVYAGYNSLNFSRYTLAGHVFLGGAVELTPGNWRITTMYGRLNKAIEEDSLNGQYILPSYKRMAFSTKVGYGNNMNSIDLILFRGWDELNSIGLVNQDTEILPEENLVLSLIGKKAITERINVTAEYANSAISRDIRSEEINLENTNLYSKVGPLFSPRATSSYNQAFNAAINYLGDFYTLQMGYERVDPGYQTLGAYFFNNDLQNMTVGGSLQLFEGALNLSGNVGLQKNNLEDTEVTSSNRSVYSININYLLAEQWNFNGSYSNFTTFTNIQPRFDPFFQNDLDTLNFYQVNQSIASTISYSFGDKDSPQSIFFNSSFQVANEDSDAEVEEALDNSSMFTSNSLAYRYALKGIGLSISSAINVNFSEIAGSQTISIGPNLSVSQAFFDKKLKTSLSSTFNNVQTAGLLNSRILNFRLGANYNIKKKHALSLNANMLRNLGVREDQQNFTELTTTINYGYSF